MNRVVALLIVPFLTVGPVFPHAHGTERAESDHSARPHLHTGHSHHDHGDHQHGHHDESNAPEESTPNAQTPVDHDSDAVYLSSGQFFLHHPEVVQADIDLACFEKSTATNAFALSERVHAIASHSVQIHNGPPLFLLHAALRL